MKKGLIICLSLLLIILPFNVNASGMLSSLSVEGIGNLDVNRTTHNLTLSTTLDHATISATPTDSSYTVTGTGDVNVQIGDNVLKVTVSDGTNTEEHTINLKVVEKGTNDTSNPDTGAFAPIALLVVVAGISYIAYDYLSRKKKFNKI